MRDTIDMASEAGIVYFSNGRWWMDAGEPGDELKAFEALVRADERNRLAKECALLPFGDTAASFAVWIKNGGNT